MQNGFNGVNKEIGSLKQEVVGIKEDISGLKQEIGEIKEELQDIRTEMATKDELEGVQQVVIRLENEMGSKMRGLYDGYVVNTEGITWLRKDVNALTDVVKRQGIELGVVRRM